ncbi:MAG: hypothetical protein ACYSUX_12110 [Planctomycetota bacterium]|jgi:hypothetical protein
MCNLKEEIAYEQKLDQIVEQLEELMLDALLAALQKIKQRNLMFDNLLNESQKNDPTF